MPDLPGVLAQIRERVLRNRGASIGEQNTKAALIEPVLRALGWDLEDLDEVRREYRRTAGDNPVDYALLILRTPRLFVEAKGLDENLEDRRWAGQIMSYAAVAGVEWVVLTNGDEYRLYNSHAPVPVEEKLFRAVRLSGEASRAEDLLDLIAKERMGENLLDALWKAHFVDRQLRPAIEGLFAATSDPSLVRLLAKRVPALTPAEIRAGLTRARIHVDFPLAPRAGGIIPGGLRSVVDPNADGGSGHEDAGRRVRQPRSRTPSSAAVRVRIADLVEAGLLPIGAPVEVRVKGISHVGQVKDGGIEVGGTWYATPSAASMAIRGAQSWNGWTDWEYRGQTLDQLRRRLAASKGPAAESSS